jgi:hypothetical protein
MRKLQCVALVLACLHPGCIWEDNGTHLAYALERGAKHLKESNSLEEVVHYEPLTGTAQTYYIEIFPSTSLQPPYSRGLTVGGRNGGGTSYHQRFVYVPTRLYIRKTNAATDIVLRKHGDRIEVVELR